MVIVYDNAGLTSSFQTTVAEIQQESSGNINLNPLGYINFTFDTMPQVCKYFPFFVYTSSQCINRGPTFSPKLE